MAVFPSREWFDALVAAAERKRDPLHALGFADIRLGLAVRATPNGDKTYGLRLENYDVVSDGEIDPAEWNADCVLEGPAEVWDEMIASIVEHGEADLEHTLNALSLAEEPMRVVADDPMGRDLFFRYNQTLQEIFDCADEVPTEFLAPA